MSSRAAGRALLGALVAGLLPACGNINQGHPVLTFTQLVSVGLDGQISNGPSGGAALSGEGRYVVFSSQATDFGLPNASGHLQIWRRDLLLQTTEAVSIGPGTGTGPVLGNDDSQRPAITADGRFVAFQSLATNLGPTNATGVTQIYLRDMNQPDGTGITLVSTDALGNPGDVDSTGPTLTPDSRYVAFESYATIFGDVHTSGVSKIYRKDTTTGAIIPISVTPTGGDPTPLNPVTSAGSLQPSISADGTLVAYDSDCIDIVPNDTNQLEDVFLATVGAGGAITTVLVSSALGGGPSNGVSQDPTISADGLWVAFDSQASNLIGFDSNSSDPDVFVYSVLAQTIEVDSVSSEGFQGATNSQSLHPSLSSDGRYVAFDSNAGNLVAGVNSGTTNVFLHDRELGTTILVSVDSAGNQAGLAAFSESPSISADGTVAAFVSEAAFVNSDTNGVLDVYARSPLH